MRREEFGETDAEQLDTFFVELCSALKKENVDACLSAKLSEFFAELSAALLSPPKYQPFTPTPEELVTFFSELEAPLEAMRSRGGFVNLWEVAGLGTKEVRTTAALAGLWRIEFGGDTSRSFLAHYLARADRGVDWEQELSSGYRVETEVNPLGDISDRIDLIVESRRYLIGIEVKICAGVGEGQLQRYNIAIGTRAARSSKMPLLILLSSYPNFRPEQPALKTSWHDVSYAAAYACRASKHVNDITVQSIGQFGKHVASFERRS